MNLYLYTDGSIQGGNPGGWAVGGWVLFDGVGRLMDRNTSDLGKKPDNTNNMAEYVAVASGISHIGKRFPKSTVVIRSDSKLVCSQLAGTWNVNNDVLKGFRDFIWRDIERHSLVVFYEWIPRAQNKAADLMSRHPYYLDENGPALAKYLKSLDEACSTISTSLRKSFDEKTSTCE